MLRVVVTCAFGLERLLAGELRRLGFSDVDHADGAVRGAGDWSLVRRASIGLRTGRRILVELADWPARDLDQVAAGAEALVTSDPGIAALLDPRLTLGVYARCSESALTDGGAVSRATLSGLLAGQHARGWATSRTVRRDPELPLRLRVRNDHAVLLMDVSGSDLDNRPRRDPKPVRATVAAGLAEVAGLREWIFDPWPESSDAIAEWTDRLWGRGPNVDRDDWPFERLPGFPTETFEAERDAVVGVGITPRILTSWDDARRIRDGLLIGCAPSGWGPARWSVFGDRLKQTLPGWRVVLLARGPDGARGLGLRPQVSRAVRDGAMQGTILGLDLWAH